MELGNTALVQGLDYAYTLQGWLKGVNGHYLSATNNMGKDGVTGSPRAVVARDGGGVICKRMLTNRPQINQFYKQVAALKQ